MNKIRMFLVASIVLAVIGSALAINSKRFGSVVYCGTVQNAIAGSSQCPELIDTDFIASPTGNRWCSVLNGGHCNVRANIVANVP